MSPKARYSLFLRQNPLMVTPLLRLTAKTLVTAAGTGISAHWDALQAERSALIPCHFLGEQLPTYLGQVNALTSIRLRNDLQIFDCRNHRLAQLALVQDNFLEAVASAKARYGKNRIALILGTTTSGILSGEQAYQKRINGQLPTDFHYATTAHPNALSQFIARYLDLTGPAFTIGTACSSSAMTFATAERFIRAGICDAAIVGGADSLCLTTLYGFTSLEIVSEQPCKPCDKSRDGLSLGEAAGFALLEKMPVKTSDMALLGYGESGDAYHISTPHPDGNGAKLAMERALLRAGLKPTDIDYINLHGTASQVNDAAETQAVFDVFGTQVPCSSTKGLTGHTLGSAGVVEVLLATLCIEQDWLPGCINTQTLDPNFRAQVLLKGKKAPVQRVLSNSFGFGGNNCCVIVGIP